MRILPLWLEGTFLTASQYSIEIDLLRRTTDLISSSNDEGMDHRDMAEFPEDDNDNGNPGSSSESEEERASSSDEDADENDAVDDYGSDSGDDRDLDLNETSEQEPMRTEMSVPGINFDLAPEPTPVTDQSPGTTSSCEPSSFLEPSHNTPIPSSSSSFDAAREIPLIHPQSPESSHTLEDSFRPIPSPVISAERSTFVSDERNLVIEPELGDLVDSTGIRRSTRKRKAIEIGPLSECLCGNTVIEEERSGAAKCSRKGCETIWVSITLVKLNTILTVHKVPSGMSSGGVRAVRMVVRGL